MGLTITVLNLSSLSWDRNIWQVGAGKDDGVNWTDEVTQVPVQTVEPHDGAATAAASTEHLGWLVQDALWIALGYQSSDGTFAVCLQQLFHMFGIGKQCEWQVLDNGSWSSSTTDATPHRWAFGTTLVTANPTLSDSGATVNIMIKDVHPPR